MKIPEKKLNVKLIAFDLDDTLLNKELTISPKTVEAIQKAVDKGIYVVLCSGRAENGILPYVRALNIAGRQHGRYLIGINGASVLDLHTRLPIYSQKLDGETLNFVYEEAKKRGLPAQVYDPSTIYASEDNAWTQIDAQMCKLNLKIEANFGQFLEKGHPKMVIPAEPVDVAKFLPFLKEKLEGKADVFISKPYFLEVMPAGVGKGPTILWLADYLGIPREQTMAFGDSMNDESMIRDCEYGVAMCNGLEYIKDIARFITRKSNNEDGIADFLESFVL
ncbi:MAG: HAD family phosphatase [Treponema sp.]|nr:HAD family phosphatase [Treponema sp.]